MKYLFYLTAWLGFLAAAFVCDFPMPMMLVLNLALLSALTGVFIHLSEIQYEIEKRKNKEK